MEVDKPDWLHSEELDALFQVIMNDREEASVKKLKLFIQYLDRILLEEESGGELLLKEGSFEEDGFGNYEDLELGFDSESEEESLNESKIGQLHRESN